MKNNLEPKAQEICAKFNLTMPFLESIIAEYGTDCFDEFLKQADLATKSSNPSTILEEAIQKTYPEQFLVDAAALARTRIGVGILTRSRKILPSESDPKVTDKELENALLRHCRTSHEQLLALGIEC